MEKRLVVAEVTKFLLNNPEPTDAQVHAWAKGKGLDIHQVEEIMYSLAYQFVKLMNEGEAKKKGFTRREADKEQLKKGIEIEYEHTSDRGISEKIALDHLAEHSNSDYYTRLAQMEKEMNKTRK